MTEKKVVRKLISKSAYLIYKQCPKYLWYHINNRDSIPEPDLRTQFNFKLGHLIGQLAKLRYKDGMEVGYYNDFDQNLKRTQELLKLGKPVFEAGFLYKDIYCDLYSRADVLVPVEKLDGDQWLWDIIEVKSSTSVKDINLYDLAFQKYCYQKAGLNIRNCYLMYINNQYIRNGAVDVTGLFVESEITKIVDKICVHIKNDLKQIAKIIYNENCPEPPVGKFCDNPFNCPLKDKCWEYVNGNSIFYLYSITEKTIKRLNECGIEFINDIPENFSGINFKQQIQIRSVKSLKAHINKEEIARYLRRFTYPVYFLDFETFASPVPLIDGTRPYQNIPFQFSMHILREPGGKPQHYSYLALGDCDPRPELLRNLHDKIGNLIDSKGSFVVYNESFEKAILRELAVAYPEYTGWLNSIINMIIDLYEPFRNFHYYHSTQKGSASVKKVLPALTGKSYDDMEISNGDIASVSFLSKSRLWKDFITSQNLNNMKNIEQDELDEEKEIERIRKSLEEYCKLDTEGLIFILKELENLI
jgi:CRISPR/Cas system-associated exonuclease Cas4 (RecB family)